MNFRLTFRSYVGDLLVMENSGNFVKVVENILISVLFI